MIVGGKQKLVNYSNFFLTRSVKIDDLRESGRVSVEEIFIQYWIVRVDAFTSVQRDPTKPRVRVMF